MPAMSAPLPFLAIGDIILNNTILEETMKLKYILFDLDGTLTDPALGITSCVNYALCAFGKGVDDLSELNEYIGPPLMPSFMEFHGLTEEQAIEGTRLYREKFRAGGIFQNELYPEIPGVLAALRDEGYTLILATSKPEEFAKVILEHFDLDKYFDCVCGNNLKEERPSKAMVIEYIISKFPDIDRENTLMVGDRRYDTEGAHTFDIRTIGVLYGYGSKDEHIAAGTDFLAETPSDILKIVRSLTKK